MKIDYQPRWKEMLDGRVGSHRFTVELSMGQLHVYFPSQEKWEAEAPKWAKGLWETAKLQAENWSRENKIPFSIDPYTWIDFSSEEQKEK